MIEIEGLPEGWKAVAYRVPTNGETCWHQNFGIYTATVSLTQCFIVEKIKPRRIVLEEDINDNRNPSIAQTLKLSSGRIMHIFCPYAVREVKETDNVKMGVNQGDGGYYPTLELNVKELRNVRSLIKDFENLGWFINPERALLLQKITEFIKDK